MLVFSLKTPTTNFDINDEIPTLECVVGIFPIFLEEAKREVLNSDMESLLST